LYLCPGEKLIPHVPEKPFFFFDFSQMKVKTRLKFIIYVASKHFVNTEMPGCPDEREGKISKAHNTAQII